MIETISLNDFKTMHDPTSWASDIIEGRGIIRVTGAIPTDYVTRCIGYLSTVMSGTLPNYHPLEPGAPNFYRLNFDDPRAYIKAFMHQFNFFAWNQDRLDLFNTLGFLFWLREHTCRTGVDYTGTVKRISFQFYPAGRGHMNPHRDPVGKHQAGVVSLVMSRRGHDYADGGFYIERAADKRIFVEDACDVGDVVIFNGAEAHGVELIDRDHPYDSLDTRGRWMALIAVTKSAGNTDIPNAEDVTHDRG